LPSSLCLGFAMSGHRRAWLLASSSFRIFALRFAHRFASPLASLRLSSLLLRYLPQPKVRAGARWSPRPPRGVLLCFRYQRIVVEDGPVVRRSSGGSPPHRTRSYPGAAR
jgi:hypothetical protein